MLQGTVLWLGGQRQAQLAQSVVRLDRATSRLVTADSGSGELKFIISKLAYDRSHGHA